MIKLKNKNFTWIKAIVSLQNNSKDYQKINYRRNIFVNDGNGFCTDGARLVTFETDLADGTYFIKKFNKMFIEIEPNDMQVDMPKIDPIIDKDYAKNAYCLPKKSEYLLAGYHAMITRKLTKNAVNPFFVADIFDDIDFCWIDNIETRAIAFYCIGYNCYIMPIRP